MTGSTGKLPTFVWEGETYIIDRRCNQVRNAANPHDYDDLDKVEQRVMLAVLNVQNPVGDPHEGILALEFVVAFTGAQGVPVTHATHPDIYNALDEMRARLGVSPTDGPLRRRNQRM